MVLNSTLLKNGMHALKMLLKLGFGHLWSEHLVQGLVRAEQPAKLFDKLGVLSALKHFHAVLPFLDPLLQKLRLDDRWHDGRGRLFPSLLMLLAYGGHRESGILRHCA